MLRRTSINIVNKTLKNNNWKILDIGCGYRANQYATVIADILDLKNFYKNKKFVKLEKNKSLPFKDNEFDFVVTSHVIEHVDDFEFFIKELERISNKGYIELPSRLADNIVFENKTDHVWWFIFDDINNQLLVSKKNQILDPFITVSTGKKLEEIFRESLILELLWEKEINYKIDNSIKSENFEKIKFLNIIKKFFSKKIRSLFKG